jgi:excisionase family DNA binding protein
VLWVAKSMKRVQTVKNDRSVNWSRTEHNLPMLATADEAASLLRTTRKAVYAMTERGLVPGVTRVGRRILFRTSALLDWLDQKSTQSPKE